MSSMIWFDYKLLKEEISNLEIELLLGFYTSNADYRKKSNKLKAMQSFLTEKDKKQITKFV